jgi:hypothetical protein
MVGGIHSLLVSQGFRTHRTVNRRSLAGVDAVVPYVFVIPEGNLRVLVADESPLQRELL